MPDTSHSAAAEISRDEIIRRRRDPSLILLDVLPAAAFAEGHIPGARNLAVADISRRAAEILPDRDADIAVDCGGFT